MMQCPFCQHNHLKKRGFYPNPHRKSPPIQRYFCHGCKKSHSTQTLSTNHRERKPYLNQIVFRLLCSGVSQRRIAELVGVSPITVARKLRRLGRQAGKHLSKTTGEVKTIVFDEMETFEHSKCKPLSIGVAVDEETRKILAVRVARMPASGHLAAISRRKYGFRADHRPKMMDRMLKDLGTKWRAVDTLKSDQCPRYPRPAEKHFPGVKHERFKGRRGCVVGQGELKRGGFDPLFALNHTCAMIRDNIKRLSRRTWCTTKKPARLQNLLNLYAHYHNEKIRGVKRLVVI